MRLQVFSSLVAYLAAFSIPVIHIFLMWKLWGKYHFPVDKASCTCECWDTVFKGPYENNISKYKTFYFNATYDMARIWLLVLTGIIILYECIKYITHIVINKKPRLSMLLLFFTSLYPHYYSLWVYVNYINDRFYEQWNHQMYFTITEILSTAIVLHLLNGHHELRPYKLLLIMAISVVHIFASGVDNFFVNIILRQGSMHGVLRDIGFLISDVSQFLVSSVYLTRMKCFRVRDRKTWFTDKLFALQIIIALLFVGISLIVLLHR